MANKVTTTGQTTFTAKVRTTGQTTFVKKIVIGTPVRSVVQQGLQFKALSDTQIVNASNNQIIAFDSALQKFVNRDSATLVNLHSGVISRTSTVDSGVYGSASQVPILTVNQSGFIDSIGTTLVAGVQVRHMIQPLESLLLILPMGNRSQQHYTIPMIAL